MNFKLIHIAETDSTNRWLRSFLSEKSGILDDVAVWADYQTAGRGCGSNSWESERGKNLTFSVLLHPRQMVASRQFHISMAVSLAICEVLGRYVGNLSIKWPNDIYWQNGKIGGILIEHSLKGSYIKDSIVGIGLNINQRVFRSDAPNPVSLWQITAQETDCEQLLHDILTAIETYMARQHNKEEYLSMLYRRKGFHPYADQAGPFMAEMADVEDDGHLVLSDEVGSKRRYAFKEVTFII